MTAKPRAPYTARRSVLAARHVQPDGLHTGRAGDVLREEAHGAVPVTDGRQQPLHAAEERDGHRERVRADVPEPAPLPPPG